jgi:hypothetical protein
LAPLEGFGFVDPTDDGCIKAGDDVADIGRGNVEELAAHIYQVDPPAGELVVKASFQTHRVITEDHHVDVVAERDGSVAQLADAVHGFKAARHADFDHIRAEGADIRDDVHMPGADIGGAPVDSVDCILDLGQLGLGSGRTIGVALFVEGAQRGTVMRLLLTQALLFTLEFAAGDRLLAQPGAFLPGAFFFFGDLGKVVRSNLQFLDAKPVVGVGDPDVHRRAELGDHLLY